MSATKVHNALRDSSNAMRASTPRKSPLTRSQARRQEQLNLSPPICEEMPDELLIHALCHLAHSENVPGGMEPSDPAFEEGSDAVVVGSQSRAARLWKNAALVSHRWRSLANAAPPWQLLRSLESGNDINWEALQHIEDLCFLRLRALRSGRWTQRARLLTHPRGAESGWRSMLGEGNII